ncbi:centrin-1-like [Zingiber officinale]|uniref:centrin-1-like n=1 Tax=Zingiber officinale TaxID=94328 RepID=UPI001C4B6FC8|nr:centrin-1-like [Zingiber officinale]
MIFGLRADVVPVIEPLYFTLRTAIMIVSYWYYPACVPCVGLRAAVTLRPTCHILDPCCTGFHVVTPRSGSSTDSHSSTLHGHDDLINIPTISPIYPRAPPRGQAAYIFVGPASSMGISGTKATRSLATGTADQRAVDDLKQQQQQQLQEPPVQNAASVEGLRRGDLELILSRMGLGPSEEDEEEDLYELLPNLFAEEEPSLEELRQAFFVFDKNDDGFIDAGELRRVLSELGVRDQRLDLDACERMIRVHDRNRDGVMDFGEFLRFMEIGFC